MAFAPCMALARWKPPGKPMVSPADFIPLAEETGLISSLGRQVLRNACLQNRLWRDKLGIPVVISVNLSARQLRSDDVVTMVAQALKESDLPPSAIKLELTESAFMDYNRGVLGVLDELKRMGVGMSIDDFGTGYSSFAYLGKMPIETIKMDKSFIEGLPGQADHIAISSAILAMAQAMKVNVVAEGVEHSGQLNFLRQHGCRWVQGYLFSRPVDAEAAEALLRKALVIPD
ncbi:MAG: EAL domain-containing protein [Planctomycetes bacterium]|nr:EAL domain-containing protein [Planctomycetota bacterium]